MVFDYNALRTWKTPDLLSRDGRLVNRTRVMGMSEKAAVIHIVTLVCTLGISLPINLGFCIWHAHRYGEIKKERTWIRQILVTRNMSYRGRGNWVEVKPTADSRVPSRAQKPAQVPPNPSRGQRPAQGPPNPSRGQRPAQGPPNPSRGQRPAQGPPNPSRVQNPVQVRPNRNRGQKPAQVQPNPNRRQNVQGTRTQPANYDPRMQQYAQANADASVDNGVQMQYVQTNVSVHDSQQDYGDYAADDNLQMQYEQDIDYSAVTDYEQDYGDYAGDDLQMQHEQDIDYSAVDLEQEIGNSDVVSEAIAPGLLELLVS